MPAVARRRIAAPAPVSAGARAPSNDPAPALDALPETWTGTMRRYDAQVAVTLRITRPQRATWTEHYHAAPAASPRRCPTSGSRVARYDSPSPIHASSPRSGTGPSGVRGNWLELPRSEPRNRFLTCWGTGRYSRVRRNPTIPPGHPACCCGSSRPPRVAASRPLVPVCLPLVPRSRSRGSPCPARSGSSSRCSLRSSRRPDSLHRSADPSSLSPADIFQLEYAADPAISPDGAWIAYVRRWSDPMTDRRYSNIWVVKRDGSGHRPLTSGKFSEDSPAWSPDGTRLAFTSNRGGSTQLWVRWMDTGDAMAVTNGPQAPSAPAWSPDGTQLAFLQLVPRPALVIGTPLSPPPGATWSAPPKYTDRLVFRQDQVGELPSGFVHAFVVPAEGGTPHQVTSGNYQHGGQVYGGGAVTWSADGRELLLAARRGRAPASCTSTPATNASGSSCGKSSVRRPRALSARPWSTRGRHRLPAHGRLRQHPGDRPGAGQRLLLCGHEQPLDARLPAPALAAGRARTGVALGPAIPTQQHLVREAFRLVGLLCTLPIPAAAGAPRRRRLLLLWAKRSRPRRDSLMDENKWLGQELPSGYDYDFTNAEAIVDRMTVNGGGIELPDGMSYRLLIVPPTVRVMRPEVVEKIGRLVEGGAAVWGPKPMASPSLSDYPACDRRIRQLADAIWGDCDGSAATEHAYGRGKVYFGQTLEKVLEDIDLPPDFSFTADPPEAVLETAHRRVGECDVYFVANRGPQPTRAIATFRVSGKQPELWRPDSGRVERDAVYREAGGQTSVPLSLAPYDAVFVVFHNPADPDPVCKVVKDGQPILDAGESPGPARAGARWTWIAGSRTGGP